MSERFRPMLRKVSIQLDQCPSFDLDLNLLKKSLDLAKIVTLHVSPTKPIVLICGQPNSHIVRSIVSKAL